MSLVIINQQQYHRDPIGLLPSFHLNLIKGKRKNLASSIWKQTPKLFQEHENWNRIFSENQKMEKVSWLEKRNN